MIRDEETINKQNSYYAELLRKVADSIESGGYESVNYSITKAHPLFYVETTFNFSITYQSDPNIEPPKKYDSERTREIEGG